MSGHLRFQDGTTSFFEDITNLTADGAWLIITTPETTHIFSAQVVAEFTYGTLPPAQRPA